MEINALEGIKSLAAMSLSFIISGTLLTLYAFNLTYLLLIVFNQWLLKRLINITGMTNHMYAKYLISSLLKERYERNLSASQH